MEFSHVPSPSKRPLDLRRCAAPDVQQTRWLTENTLLRWAWRKGAWICRMAIPQSVNSDISFFLIVCVKSKLCWYTQVFLLGWGALCHHGWSGYKVKYENLWWKNGDEGFICFITWRSVRRWAGFWARLSTFNIAIFLITPLSPAHFFAPPPPNPKPLCLPHRTTSLSLWDN